MASKASNTTVTGDQAQLDEMFGGDEFNPEDLLDSVVEDNSEGWKPEAAGDAIVGTVVARGVTKSQYPEDGIPNPERPTVSLKCRVMDANGVPKFDDKGEPEYMVWRVIGFSKILRSHIEEDDPQPGDTWAVKYFGQKSIRTGPFKGKLAHSYGTNIRRAPENRR
jgi:hypothetical protein